MLKVCPHCRTEYPAEQITCPNDGARLDEPMAARPDPLIGQLLADRYRVLRMLGEGGMGRVYLAEHVRMGRLSAVKVMSGALAPTEDAVGRFNREAANASRINHPNVAAIYDFGEAADGTLYLAMEYVEGETLAALLRREGSLPLPRVSDLLTQTADALNAAHHLGIVHRDLKPDNILVTRDHEGRERVKVVDFGIAKTVQGGGQTVTTAGMSIGTPEFMSPEQLAGEQLDARTDIYSLGLVTFLMLAGALPFPDVTSKQALVRRLTEPPRSLADVRPDVTWPAMLQRALDHALAPEPRDRYATVGDFALEVASARARLNSPAATTRPMTPLRSPVVDDASIARSVPARRSVGPAQPVATSAPARTPRVRSKVAVLTTAGALVAIAGWFAASRASEARAAHADSTALVRLRATKNLESDSLVLSQSRVAPGAATSVGTKQEQHTAMANTPAAVGPSRYAAASADTGHKAAAPLAAAPMLDRQNSFAATSNVVRTASPSRDSSATQEEPRRLTRHAWLKASGDSASQPIVDESAPAAEAREALGHISRARRLVLDRELGRAGGELRTAYTEYSAFVSAHGVTRESMLVRERMREVSLLALSACRASRGSLATSARVQGCDPLERAVARATSPDTIVPDIAGGRRARRPFRGMTQP